MISKRISETCWDSDHSHKAASDYNIVVINSEFNETTRYILQYSISLKRDKLFGSIPHIVILWKLKLVKFLWRHADKLFPWHHRYYKLFNRKSIRLS